MDVPSLQVDDIDCIKCKEQPPTYALLKIKFRFHSKPDPYFFVVFSSNEGIRGVSTGSVRKKLYFFSLNIFFFLPPSGADKKKRKMKAGF